MTRTMSLGAAVVVAIALLAVSAVAAQAAFRSEISLSSSVIEAKARFEDRGNEQRFRVEVEDATRNQRLDVCVDGQLAGTITVNALGNARLALNSDLGQAVPDVVSGTLVEVRMAASPSCGGTVLALGNF